MGEKILTADSGTGQVGKRYSLQTMEQDKQGKDTHCRQWNRTSGKKVLTADHGTGQVGQRYSLQTVVTQLDQQFVVINGTSGEKVLTGNGGTGQAGKRYSLQTVVTQLDQHLQLAVLKRHPVQKLWQLH